MSEDRPLGVKLITIFYLLKSGAMILALITAYADPDLQASAQAFIAQLAPPLQSFHSDIGLIIAPLFVVFGITIAMGIWLLKRWARLILLLESQFALAKLAIVVLGLTAFDHKLLSLLNSSPYFVIDVFSSVLMVFYLLDPEVRTAFREPD
jgi:hypothetical protein